MEHKFKLGDRLKDKVTGYEGIAIFCVEHMNGCVQYGLKAGLDKDGKSREAINVDEQQIEWVDHGINPSEPLPAPAKSASPGGIMSDNAKEFGT